MLQFKIKEILIGRGIVQPYTWLRKKGNFSQNKAMRLLHQKVASVTLLDLSKLCLLLGCTPNDLLYWQQDKKYNLDADHPCMQELEPPHVAEQWETVLQKLKTADVLALHQQLSAKAAATKKPQTNAQEPPQVAQQENTNFSKVVAAQKGAVENEERIASTANNNAQSNKNICTSCMEKEIAQAKENTKYIANDYKNKLSVVDNNYTLRNEQTQGITDKPPNPPYLAEKL